MSSKNFKIGIMTFHDAINYGALLQAYALHTWIRQEGYICDVVDYECEQFKNSYKVFNIYDYTLKGLISAVLKTPYCYIKKKKFRSFSKKHIYKSNEKYNSKNIEKSNEFYDVFITGSDQVWNLKLTGGDKNYFLNFVDDSNYRISYAASIGDLQVLKNEKYIFKEELEKYSSISVRESDARDLLNKFFKFDVKHVLDPVFLLNKDQWRNIFSPKISEKYILVYLLHEQTVYSISEKLSKLTGFKVICIQNTLNKKINAKYILTAGIEEFLSYAFNAEYIVTDSFHGAAFGVIFRKNLKIVMKKQLKELNGRLETLVNEFGLEKAVVNMNTDDDVLLEKVDYKLSEEKINYAIKTSKNYLREALRLK